MISANLIRLSTSEIRSLFPSSGCNPLYRICF